jgi:hypothetical protein
VSIMLVGPIPSRYALLIPKGFLQSFHHLDSESVCSIVRNVRIVACFCNGTDDVDYQIQDADGEQHDPCNHEPAFGNARICAAAQFMAHVILLFTSPVK